MEALCWLCSVSVNRDRTACWVRGMCSGITQLSRDRLNWCLKVWWELVQLK